MWGLTRGDLNGQGSVRVALKEGWFRGVWVGGGSYTWKIKRIGLSASSLEGGVGGGVRGCLIHGNLNGQVSVQAALKEGDVGVGVLYMDI